MLHRHNSVTTNEIHGQSFSFYNRYTTIWQFAYVDTNGKTNTFCFQNKKHNCSQGLATTNRQSYLRIIPIWQYLRIAIWQLESIHRHKGNANCFYVQTKKCTVKEISSTNRHSFSFTIYIAYIDTNGNTKITVKEFLITNRYERIVKGIWVQEMIISYLRIYKHEVTYKKERIMQAIPHVY